MNCRNLVTFIAHFPDDAQWDEQGNALVPGGRAIAEAIRGQLEARGIACSSVAQHSFYGWAFQTTCGNSKVWCLLQAGDSWLLELHRRTTLLSRLFGSVDTLELQNLQQNVQDILVRDNRFANVLWYTRSDYESGKKERARPRP
jgi:hypothetical protein